MREQIRQLLQDALSQGGIQTDAAKIQIDYPETNFGDYASNAALVLAKAAKINPMDLARTIADKLDKSVFESVEVAGPGFINFKLKLSVLSTINYQLSTKPEGKILLEYFQPNIAKPLHVGHMRTAVIGDALKRMLKYAGYQVESDTHMGDWGTQFGYLILAQKKFGKVNEQIYAELNADEAMRESAKQEFVALEQGDPANRKIWQKLVEESVKKFLAFAETFGLLLFDHHWPESFYEDKMPDIVEKLESSKLLKLSQGAQVVDLEKQGLGVAIIIKSDGGTTYLLRDLATFIFAKAQGFTKHLYVVDNRQALHYKQLFAILALMGEWEVGSGKGAALHINYGFVSFKGEALSTRQGNMVLAEDLMAQAQDKVAKIIAEKNPGLKQKHEAVTAIALGALKYFDLKHNRHSDMAFDWDEVLDFEGNSGPYLQYAYARLASILRKANPSPGASHWPPAGQEVVSFPLPQGARDNLKLTKTERELLFKSSILPEIVEDALQDYLPNLFADYLYELATLINRFYHESPVTQEKDEQIKAFRLYLVSRVQKCLAQGLELLGIRPLEEM